MKSAGFLGDFTFISICINYRPGPSEYRYNQAHQFDGILKNISPSSFRITSSSVYKNQVDSSPLNVINYDDYDNSFSSGDESNSWICFDFLQKKVDINTYVIRSSKFDAGLSHLKSWVIEGSNDGRSWETLANEKNCNLLNGPNYIAAFNIRKSKKCRYIRLRQTDVNWRGRHYLKFNSIEFFGKVY